MPDTALQVAELLASAHINPMSFEAELGLLIHKWLMMIGLDNVLEGIDAATDALEANRDLQLSVLTDQPPAQT